MKNEDFFFSICIPQYNRKDKLIRLLRSISIQKFRNFEVCISDGCSTDNSLSEAVSFLKSNNLSYSISTSSSQRFYDENLRSAISISKGKFLFFIGNDDQLLNELTLHNLYKTLVCINFDSFGLLISNYQSNSDNIIYCRIGNESNGKTYSCISDIFRSLSFVSGLIFQGELSRRYSSSIADGSEMYQMYLASRILSSNCFCHVTDQVTVLKDNGDYEINVNKLRYPVPMSLIPKVINYGLENNPDRSTIISDIILQVYVFIYPYWIKSYFSFKYLKSWTKFSKSLFAKNVFPGNKKILFVVMCNSLIIISMILSIIVPNFLMKHLYKCFYFIAKNRTSGRIIKK